jgi:hypothetical protein
MSFIEQRLGSPGARLRLAALLLVITLSIVASKMGEDHFVQSLRKDCSSLFTDRLIPATTLFHLSDAVYQRREALLHHLRSDSNVAPPNIQYRLGQHNAKIEHHIETIEKTFLVADESRLLKKLRGSLEQYSQVESALLARHDSGTRLGESAELHGAFEELRAELLNLTQVQEAVGEELKTESLASATHLTTLLYFQLGVAFALGILASGLATSLRTRNTDSLPPPQGPVH